MLIFKESDARKLLRKRQGEIALDRFIGPESERVTVRELAKDYLNDLSSQWPERALTKHDAHGETLRR